MSIESERPRHIIFEGRMYERCREGVHSTCGKVPKVERVGSPCEHEFNCPMNQKTCNCKLPPVAKKGMTLSEAEAIATVVGQRSWEATDVRGKTYKKIAKAIWEAYEGRRKK
jgi:hypothetical protein